MDSRGSSYRLFDWLNGELGNGNVFLDIDVIPAGASFKEVILDVLRLSSIVLVIIGRAWLDVEDIDGKRRIDDPSDFIRIEIEAALELGKPIIPVLVDGATLPVPSQLPPSIEKLVSFQAIEVRPDPNFGRDVHRLLEIIRPPAPTLADRIGAAVRAFRSPVLKPNSIQPLAPSARTPHAEATRIFLSHSHHDNHWCRAFVSVFPVDYQVWFDETNMQIAPSSFVRKLEDEILHCKIFIVVLTPEAISSEWVIRECDLAMKENKVVVPVRLRTTDVRGFLSLFPQINVEGMDAKEAAREVVNALVNYSAVVTATA
jgi:hypothetical protein